MVTDLIKTSTKEQLHGSALDVEANLQEVLSVHFHFTKLKC